jgi:hypothetical protein
LISFNPSISAYHACQQRREAVGRKREEGARREGRRWRERKREIERREKARRERECVCVCVWEREREFLGFLCRFSSKIL